MVDYSVNQTTVPYTEYWSAEKDPHVHSKMLGATKIEGPEWGGMGTGIGLNFVLRFKSLGMGKKKMSKLGMG